MNQREPKMKKKVWTARGRRGPGGVRSCCSVATAAIARFSQAWLEVDHAHVAAHARLLEHDSEVSPQGVPTAIVNIRDHPAAVQLDHPSPVTLGIRRRPERYA